MEEPEKSRRHLTSAGWILVSGIIATVLIIVAAFYWFELRPEDIRKSCDKWATYQSNYLYSVAPAFSYNAQDDSYQSLYQSCINSHGL